MTNLGNALRLRYEILDQQADGDRAIKLCRRATELSPVGRPDRATYWANLADAFLVRFRRATALEDIDAAVDAGRKAERLLSDEHPNRSAILTNLANGLRARYEQTFALSDLDEAIQLHRSAVDATPNNHPSRPQTLANLSISLISRLTRVKGEDPAVVDEMVSAARSAAEAVPFDHPARTMLLSGYANALHLRHSRTKDPNDAAKEIAALEEALRITPDDHPNRMMYLGNLAVALEDRRTHSRKRRDLNAVVKAGEAAVRATPADYSHLRSRIMYNLGIALLLRAGQAGSLTDSEAAISLFRDASRIATAPIELRIRSARRWGNAARILKLWPEAVAGYRTAIELLPLLAWHGLDRADRVSALGEFAGLASSAAASALMLGDPEQALQMLEQGRGVLLSQALDARSDLSELATVDPDLAERMRTIRSELDAAITPNAADERGERMLADRRRELAREWDTLLARARALPGLADLLRLPSPERLRAPSTEGTVVVVNVHARRCDALIVTTTGPRALALPGLSEAEVRDRATTLLDAMEHVGSRAGTLKAKQVLSQVLRWLWDTVAEPVLAALPSDPVRIWWCPTGLLSLLPLHAAGHYRQGSRDTLLDRAICSYTPTLRALADAQCRPPAPARMLAVGQPATPGLSPLPQAMAEVLGVASRMQGTTLLNGTEATREAVLAALPDHSYLHFAGHGGQNPHDAASGALYLDDHKRAGPLGVVDISNLRLDQAELAFLSACETARGVTALPDEATHMAGAMHLAGFTHVVATQWGGHRHACDRHRGQLLRGPCPQFWHADKLAYGSIAAFSDATPARRQRRSDTLGSIHPHRTLVL